jgi:lipid-binding SYLF domain-containing protein
MKFANKQIAEIPLTNLTISQFLTLAMETSGLLGWVFGDMNTSGFIAYTNNGFSSWNAEVKLKIMNDKAILQSGSRGDDLIDVRENKKNLQKFISTFNGLKKSMPHKEAVPKYGKLKSGFSPN